jgi:membrane-bound lytic murein transglycosylase B
MAIGALTAAVALLLAGGGAAPPDPQERLPTGPQALGERLRDTEARLDRAVGAWLRDGDPARGEPPEDVTLLALDQQRALRLLARRPDLERRVLARQPPERRTAARRIAGALRALGRLTPPSRRSRLRTGPPLPAGRLLGFYRREERRHGVPWHVLAAVNLVESAFGRLRNDSVAGAQGPMQFVPETWAAYGLGGDVHDPADAIRGAANYLAASGARRSHARALYAYNRSPLYVRAVLAYARTMARRPRAFYELYAWQAYMRTKRGEVRLTGPGLG